MTTTALEKLLRSAAASQGKTITYADGTVRSYPVYFDQNGKRL